MQQIKMFVEKNSGKIKTIFVCSVFIIVVREILTISKNTSGAQLKEIISGLPIGSLFLLILVGILSVTPMMLYDFILNRLIRSDRSSLYIVETSWITNTLNNLCGFGGIISGGLRIQFYSKGKSAKEFLKSLSKIWLFLFSGLSIYSLVTLAMIFFHDQNQYLQQYWIWLVAGGLYFPILFLITRLTKKSFFDDLTIKYEWSLILASFLEWTGVACSFIVAGRVLGESIPVMDIIPLLIASSIIGIISLLPGAVGSFDIMMIIGLSNLGVSHEKTIAWLLLYRLAYYLVPFILGLGLFAKNLSGKVNHEFDGIPKVITAQLSHVLVSFLLYFSGIMLVLAATVPDTFSNYPILQKINPLSFHFLAQMPSVILGFLLLILGRGFFSRVEKVYIPTMFVLIGSIVYTILSDFSWGITIFLCMVIFFVWLAKSQLYRKQLVLSWEAITFDGIVYGVLILLYIGIGVYNLPMIHQKHHKIEFFLFPSERIWFLGFVSICIVSLFLLVLRHYLSSSRVKIGEKADIHRIKNLLEAFGGNETSQLSFLNDKLIYFYQDKEGVDRVFFQFQIQSNKCLVMGEASGDPAYVKKATEQFISDADELGYLLVFYEVKENNVMMLHEYGYDFLKIGEEGYVDLPTFTLSGKKARGERALVNKIERENFSFEMCKPPFSKEFLAQLNEISDEWLDGQVEKGFSLGYFDDFYLSQQPIAVVKDSAGNPVAFANIMNTFTTEQATVDLMRYKKSSPPGIMDYLFISLFMHFKEQGVPYFNMGMAPLSNVGQSKRSFIQERVAFFIYKFGQRFYSFEGLRHYKDKYATKWIPKYTAYPKESSLVFTMLQLLKIINRPVLIHENESDEAK